MLLLQVEGIRVEKTRLVEDPERGTVAVGTGQFVEYPVQLVLKSIGYASLPLGGVPFDTRRGIVPNAGGRVLTGVRLACCMVLQLGCRATLCNRRLRVALCRAVLCT